MIYVLHLLIMCMIYVMLAQSLSLTSGYLGLISLSHAGFYGTGAYVSSILTMSYDFPFLLSLGIAIAICGLMGLLISIIALRTVDDYFIIITLGIQFITYSVFNNCDSLTNGALGLSGIPPLSNNDNGKGDQILFTMLCFLCMSLVYFVVRNVTRSPFGRIMIGVSEDEIYTASLGKSVFKVKVVSFTLGGMLAAIPGVLYARYIGYIAPDNFNIDESVFILSILIIGGFKHLNKIALAAIGIVLLPELLRFIGLPNSNAHHIRELIYGSALVCSMVQLSKLQPKDH